jgi:hypothetical protein
MYNFVKRGIRHTLCDRMAQLIQQHSMLEGFQAVLSGARGEKEQHAIVVGPISRNAQFLDTHDFIDVYRCKSYLVPFSQHPARSLEWALENNDTAERPHPGIYILTMADSRHFTIAPLFEYREVLRPDTDTFTLAHAPIFEPRLRIDDQSRTLTRDKHYTINWATGEVTLLPAYDHRHLPLIAVYLVAQPELGSFSIEPYRTHVEALPGLVLAFGGSLQPNDKHVIIVSSEEEANYNVYGGAGECSLSIDVMTPRKHVSEDAADLIQLTLNEQRAFGLDFSDSVHIRSINTSEAVEEESPAGEKEWTASVSISAEIFWSIYVPNVFRLRDIWITLDDDVDLSDEQIAARDLGIFQQLGFDSKFGEPRLIMPGHAIDGKLIR